MSAMTIGICIDRCPHRYPYAASSGRENILQLYVRIVEKGETFFTPTLDQVERHHEFAKAMVWLEEDMRRRRAAERSLP